MASNEASNITDLGLGADNFTLAVGSAALTSTVNAAGFTAGAATTNDAALANAVINSAGFTVDLGAVSTGAFGYTVNNTNAALGAALSGSGLADAVTGSAAADTLIGNGGNDTLTTGGGNDSVAGSAGTDNIVGNAGTETINGGSGNDTINGAAGADNLNGDSDNDVFLFNTGDVVANEVISGGAGTDTALVQTTTVFTNLSTATLLTAGGVENVQLTNGQNATFTGSQVSGQAISINKTAAGGAASTLTLNGLGTTALDVSGLTFTATGTGNQFGAGGVVTSSPSLATTQTTPSPALASATELPARWT